MKRGLSQTSSSLDKTNPKNPDKKVTISPSDKWLEIATDRLNQAVKEIPKSSVKNSNIKSVQKSQILLGERLGVGAFATVHEIRCINWKQHHKRDQTFDNTKNLVIKTLIPNRCGPEKYARNTADLAKEALFLASLDHPNIMRINAWSKSGLHGLAIVNQDPFFFVMERLDQTLNDRIDDWTKRSNRIKFSITQREARRRDLMSDRLGVVCPLADALRYLHNKRILHRDLKPENIGFTKNGVLKLFDFGVSCTVPASKSPHETFNLTKKVGSRRYMSPECGRGLPYNLKSDVYSFGLIFHQILSLEKPFAELSTSEHKKKVFLLGLRPHIPKSWPTVLQNLIARCWGEYIRQRPSMRNVCDVLERETPAILSGGETCRDWKPWSPENNFHSRPIGCASRKLERIL